MCINLLFSVFNECISRFYCHVTFVCILFFFNHLYSDHYSLSNEIDLILKLVLIAKQTDCAQHSL